MAVKASATITLFDVVDVDGTTIYYLLQSSTANPPAKPTTDNPGGNWSTTEPSYTEGSTNTLYMVTKTKYSDGTFEYTPVSKSSSYEAAKLAYNKAMNAQDIANTTQENLNNLQIGGRNYILKSDIEKTLTIPSTHYVFTSLNIAPALKKNDPEYKTYVFSLDAKYEYEQDEDDHEVYAQLYFRNDGNSNKFGMNGAQITREWKRYSFAATFGSNNQASILDAAYVYFRGESQTQGVIVHGKNFKVEKGNKSTDWTLAPEDIESNIPEVVVGTQTKQTRYWTGVANKDSLSDGDEIIYWLPYASVKDATSKDNTEDKVTGVVVRTSSTTTKPVGTPISTSFSGGLENTESTNVWLNLTLKNGNTTGWIPCYYGGTTRLTTHYGAGNCIRLIYRVNASVNGVHYTGFFGDANYVGNDTYDRIRFNNSIKAKSAIGAGRLIVGDDVGYFHLLAGVTFKIDKPILWANANIAANSTGSDNYLSKPSLTIRNNTSSSWTATQYKTLYLVGVLNGDMFTVDSTPFTTTTPTVEDGKYYISLGYMASTYQIYLYPEHPIYKYVNGSFKNLNQVAYEAQYGIDNLTIGGRNLIKGTSKEWKPVSVSRNYGVILSSNDFFGLNVGDEYTVKYKLKSDSGKELIMRIQFYTDNDHRTSIHNDDLSIQNSEGYLYITSVLTEAQRNYTRMEIAVDANRTANTITDTTTEYYAELKLEKGNKATDWTPAPEDSDNVISQDTAPEDTSAVWFNTHDNLFYKYNGEDWIAVSDYNEDISRLKEDVGKIDSTIDGKINAYNDEIKNIYYTKAQVDSQIETNERGIKEYYSGTLQTIREDATGLSNRITAIEGYIQKGLDDNGQPFVELGTEASPYKLKITNDAIQITYLGEPVSNWKQDLIELNTVITSYLNLGKFSFIINSDDSVSFKKIR